MLRRSFVIAILLLLVGCVPVRVPGGKGAPFPSPDGLRVLIVEETEHRPDLPRPQLDILTANDATSVRAWLKANALEFRIFDKDSKADRDTAVWQAAMKANPPSPPPYMLAANGKRGFSIPLPADRAAALAALAKVKGNK